MLRPPLATLSLNNKHHNQNHNLCRLLKQSSQNIAYIPKAFNTQLRRCAMALAAPCLALAFFRPTDSRHLVESWGFGGYQGLRGRRGGSRRSVKQRRNRTADSVLQHTHKEGTENQGGLLDGCYMNGGITNLAWLSVAREDLPCWHSKQL